MTNSSPASPLELSVTNFGPIAEGRIELRPMTVFVGPSNTGKSYMAALLYALQRSFGGRVNNDDLFSLPNQIHRRRLMETLQKLNVSDKEVVFISHWLRETIAHLEQPSESSPSLLKMQERISKLVQSVIEKSEYMVDHLERELSRCFGVQTTGQLVLYPSEGESSLTISRKFSAKTRSATGFHFGFNLTPNGPNFEATFPVLDPLLATDDLEGMLNPWRWLSTQFQHGEEHRRESAFVAISNLAVDSIFAAVEPLDSFAYYLPADRGGILHAHPVLVRAMISGASRTSFRTDSHGKSISGVLADFLEQLVALSSASQLVGGKCEKLARSIESRILRGAVRVEDSEIEYPSIVYTPNGWERDLPALNASSMVSELAPVVLYLRHLVQPGNLLIIEEPEAHLHPEMQAKFTRFLVAAVQSGIRILITTHSEWILEELANLVRLTELPFENRDGIEDPEIALSPEQLGAWFFEPSKDAGGSVIREISLDEESATFPAGFGLVTEALYNRWVEISTRIQEE